MTNWDLTHTIHTLANKETAWKFMTDMSNMVRMEPGIERIELDGPFANGTVGRTISPDSTQEWVLSEVVEKGKLYPSRGILRLGTCLSAFPGSS